MPISAKSYAAQAVKQDLAPWSFERRDPNPDDVVIDIKYCGLCHSDIHQVDNDWGGALFPMVPGHEIAGVVRDVGAQVTQYKKGDHVGVGVYVDSCGKCRNCKKDESNYCFEGFVGTYSAKEYDGKTITYGGYSDVIVVKADHVLRIPDSLPLDKAAPLLCAGITLYSPLAHWKAGPGKRVAIVGLGGLGHMGVKIAAALGADVTVISQTDSKKDDALRFGAKRLLATKGNDKIFEENKFSFDLIINTISAPINLDQYVALLDTDGTWVNLSGPPKPLEIFASSLNLQRRSLAGSVIGSIKETQEMLDFCGEHNITPEIEVIAPTDVNDAYKRMQKSDVRYRFVMDVHQL